MNIFIEYKQWMNTSYLLYSSVDRPSLFLSCVQAGWWIALSQSWNQVETQAVQVFLFPSLSTLTNSMYLRQCIAACSLFNNLITHLFLSKIWWLDVWASGVWECRTVEVAGEEREGKGRLGKNVWIIMTCKCLVYILNGRYSGMCGGTS